jgi:hypothetical protein
MITRTEKKSRLVAFKPAVWLALALAIGACEDDDDIDIITPPLPIIGTVAVFADSLAPFGEFKTFAMPDTVVHFNPLGGTAVDVRRTFDRDVLDRVRANFISRGYVEELNPDSVAPDFLVLVGATASENRQLLVPTPFYDSWSFYNGLLWYAPGFDNSWTIVYPCCANVTLPTPSRGTLVVDLIPTLSVNPLSRSIASAWAGVATTAITGAATAASLNAAIDQMFLLSPYLRADSLIVNPL